MALTDEQLSEIVKPFKRTKHVVYNGVDLVFRNPTRVECRQHMAKINDPAQRPDADDQLAQILIVACGESTDVAGSRKAFLTLLDDYPYLTRNDAVGGALAMLTGVVQDESVKT